MIKRKKVVIATHVYAYGKSQALQDYLQNKAEVLFIGHSMIGNLFTWGLGAINTFYQVFKTGKKYDLYFGSNSLNAFIGLALQKTGRIKKVIFYAPDLPQNRFQNKILNKIYHQLDLFCVKKADHVWNNLNSFVKEREKRGLLKKYRCKQIEVPAGTHLIKQTPFKKINRYLIGFSGHLTAEKGLELMIRALPEIRKKIPQIKFLIIGNGPNETKLKNLVHQLKLKNVIFSGYIKDIKKVYRKLSKCALAIAPYPSWSRLPWGNPSKVKVYLSAGLPIIITNVPKIAWEIDKKKAGIMIKYNRQELVKAVVKLLKNEKLLKAYRKNVQQLANQYNYEKIFKKALSSLEW